MAAIPRCVMTDATTIPAIREREVEAATGERHVFRRLGVPSVLRLRLSSVPQRRHEDLTASLVARFAATSEATASTSRATPVLGPMLPIRWRSTAFAHRALPMPTELFNSSFPPTHEPAPEVLSYALNRFQESVQILASGEPDQATRDRLVAAYGS